MGRVSQSVCQPKVMIAEMKMVKGQFGNHEKVEQAFSNPNANPMVSMMILKRLQCGYYPLRMTIKAMQ